MNNRKLIIYSLAGALFLLAVVIFAILNLFSEKESRKGEADAIGNGLLLYSAVPSDAVMIMHLNSATPFFGNNRCLKGEKVESAVSLHYSAKNEVSPLYILDCGSCGAEQGTLFELMKSGASREKRYNSADIYNSGDSLYFSLFGQMMIASSSIYVLENSIRHLENGTSILDNTDFKRLAEKGGNDRLFINHAQIGKFFSGVTNSNVLKHSDFFLHFASWSSFEIETDGFEGGKIWRLSGQILNNSEERFYSALFCAQQPMQSYAASVLPATTAFAVALPFFSSDTYVDGIRQFKAVQKELNDYDYIQARTAIEGKLSPAALADSLNIEEVVAAYCSFGGEYDWVTLIREKENSSFASLFSNKEAEVEVKPYEYKNYISSVFGDIFSNCKEESYCKYDGWTVIGPQLFVKAFARGAAKQFTLEDCLLQTPARSLFSDAVNMYIAIDLKQLGGNMHALFKEEYASLIDRFTGKNNFAYLSVALFNENSSVLADINIYGGNLEKLPAAKIEDDGAFIVADSTIKVENGIFELKDFISGGKCYLEQSENLNLRYMDGKKRGLWTIPFKEPLCGRVEQIDFYNNGKLQMLFATGDKLYLLDRLGRIVTGFPVEFKTPVVLGPKVIREYGGVYTAAVIDVNNTIALYSVTGNRLQEPVEIRCGEFVNELPDILSIEGEEYLFVKTISQTKIYTMQGFEITGREKRRKIARESKIEVSDNSEIEYTGTDGKRYIMDLNTGRSRKTD